MAIRIIESLVREIEKSDGKTKKLFKKQKLFMEMNPHYNSLGRTKLKNVYDKYGNQLWEIRLDGKRRIVFVEKGDVSVWLKICDHDEIKRNNTINIGGNY